MELLGIISVSEWLLIPLVVGVAFYWFFTKKYGLWEKQGIPELRPTLVFGGLLDLFRKHSTDVEKERYKKYGRLYGTFEGDRPALSVSKPEMIKAVLVKDFHVFNSGPDLTTGCPMVDLIMGFQKGENWKRTRSIITPAFTSGRLRQMAPLLEDTVQSFLKLLLEDATGGKDVDILKWYNKLVMATVARCAFGIRLSNLNDENHPFVQNSRKIFTPSGAYKFILKRFFPTLTKMVHMELFPSERMNYFKNVTKNIIQQRKELNQRSNDFLQLIIDALEGTLDTTTQEDTTGSSHFDVGGSATREFHSSTWKKFASEEEALAQCILFLAFGVDPTAVVSSFVTYDLALHQECQDKLIAEVDEFWKGKPEEIDLTEVNSLAYLEAFISESLRFHAIAPRLERIAHEDYVFADNGIKVPKGTLVTIPVSAIHWDPEWFPQPDKFDPERFLPENRRSLNPYTFMPFGAGPRNCVARRLALLQLKLNFIHLLKHIRFLPSPKTKIPLEMRRAGPAAFPTSVIVKIERRHNT